MTFAGRLVAGTLAVIVIALVILVAGVEFALRRDLMNDIRVTLLAEAQLVAQVLDSDSTAWQAQVERIGRQTGRRITLIATDGRVVAESDEPAETVPRIENHGGRPEVRDALATGVGTSRRVSATVDRDLLYVAIRGGPGVVRVAAPLSGVDAIVKQAHRSLLDAAGVALLLAALLAFAAGRSIARPLTAISHAARAIAEGAPPRFPRSGIPDVDNLVRALREMHEQLDRRFMDLRRERAETAALVEAMVEGVIAADERGRIVMANAAARRLLGYGPDEQLPAVDQLFRIKSAREVVDAVLGGNAVLERGLELDGHSVLLSGRPLPQGGVLLVLHDVTELRRLETVRRDFVANVSHELKTPLTSISGYAETLVHDQADQETTQRFLGVILANARRMQRLVDGLLDLSRIESGGWRPEPEALDIAGIVRESWGLVADRAAGQDIAFDVVIAPDAGQIHADPVALRQVLSNLLDNALRYTPPGGRITITARHDRGGVGLAVRDTGIGVTREHLPRIFERFYRADAGRSRDQGGTGLGLAIVRHLVEAHGGQVTAESELGRGTEIRCWFPAAPAALTAVTRS